MLRDIQRGKDAQLIALAEILQSVRPDVLVLTKVDFDAELQTAKALQSFLNFEYSFALPPNSMTPSALDLDGDGKSGDRFTWVRYAGEGAMLLLSQHPILPHFHLNDLLWKDVPEALMPIRADATPFPSPAAQEVMPIVGQGLWVVQIGERTEDSFTLVAFQNQTPVFDGPEDMNGLRSSAQLGLLSKVMDGTYGAFPDQRFALIGNSNLDPNRGQGDREAMRALLRDPRLQDPMPSSPLGDDATAIWDKAGNMRVSYILPSKDWIVPRAAVVWPSEGPLHIAAEQASRHRLIWMDLTPSPP